MRGTVYQPPQVARHAERDAVRTSGSHPQIPLAMSALMDSGDLRRGDPILIFGFGAGLTYCGQIVRCP